MATRWQCSTARALSAVGGWRGKQPFRGRENTGLRCSQACPKPNLYHPETSFLYFLGLPLTTTAMPSGGKSKLWPLNSCMILADFRNLLLSLHFHICKMGASDTSFQGNCEGKISGSQMQQALDKL